MKLIALCTLALVATADGQSLLPVPTPRIRPPAASPVAMPQPDRALIPLVFMVRGGSSDVLLDSDAAASNGLHLPGLTVVGDDTPEACGSGVIISTDGYIVTAAHVVGHAFRIQVVTTAGPRRAICVAYDEVNDLAVLKMAGSGYPAIPVRASDTVTCAEPAIMIGIRAERHWGYTQRVACGTVARHPYDPRCWQANVPARPGHSGGALLDARGRLIGVMRGALENAHGGEGCERPTEITTIAVKTAYALPLLPHALKRPTAVAVAADVSAVIAAAEPAVVTVLRYGAGAPPVAPRDTGWQW